MRFLIVGLGSAGDVYPNIGVGVHLRRRGHQVQLFAAPAFRESAERAGLEFVPLGTEEDFRAAVEDPELWHPYRSFHAAARRMVIPAVRPVYEALAERYVPGETVVAAPAAALGARIAREKLGVPLATVHLQPVLIRSCYATPVFGHPNPLRFMPRFLKRWHFRMVDALVIDRLLAPEVNALRAELGLPPVRRVFHQWCHSPDLVLCLFPDWFAPPQPDWPPNTHLTGFPLYDDSGAKGTPPGLEPFLEAGDPPVVFTAGSAMAHAARFFEVSAEVCVRLGRRGVLVTQFPEQLPPRLPEGVRHFAYVPFGKLLPRAAAIVHHGGIGTTAQAFAAGIPQLVVPLAHDQFDNADRVRRLGAGRELAARRYTADRVARDLSLLLDSPDYRERSRELSRRMSSDAAFETACDRLESLARSPRPAARH